MSHSANIALSPERGAFAADEVSHLMLVYLMLVGSTFSTGIFAGWMIWG